VGHRGALASLNGNPPGFFDLQRSSLDLLLERFALEILRTDPHMTVVGLIDVVGDADAGVLQG